MDVAPSAGGGMGRATAGGFFAHAAIATITSTAAAIDIN
jgi:hypothetical protein